MSAFLNFIEIEKVLKFEKKEAFVDSTLVQASYDDCNNGVTLYILSCDKFGQRGICYKDIEILIISPVQAHNND